MKRYPGNSHDLAATASKLGGGPISVCDFSGFQIDKADQVLQEAYNSTGLYSTGFRVHRKFMDTPNPSVLLPPLKNDPRPVFHVKKDTQGLDAQFPDWADIDVTLEPAQFDFNTFPQTLGIQFLGEPTIPHTINFINGLFQFKFWNNTGQNIILGIQGSPLETYRLLPQSEPVMLCWNLQYWEQIFLDVG